MKEKLKIKINKIINDCDKHLLRINSAYDKAIPIFPLNAEKYNSINENFIEHIDQYLFRFSKLQDTMGNKLFKSVLLYLDEDIENLSFLDILNKLEKLQFITSAQDWRLLREVRNELAHEYNDNAEEMSLKLNKIFDLKKTIENIYNNFISKLKQSTIWHI